MKIWLSSVKIWVFSVIILRLSYGIYTIYCLRRHIHSQFGGGGFDGRFDIGVMVSERLFIWPYLPSYFLLVSDFKGNGKGDLVGKRRSCLWCFNRCFYGFSLGFLGKNGSDLWYFWQTHHRFDGIKTGYIWCNWLTRIVLWGSRSLEPLSKNGEGDGDLGFERRMVWPLRDPFFRWFYEGLSVHLVCLGLDLSKSRCFSHVFEGNQTGSDWVNGMSGWFLRISRFWLRFIGILKMYYCRIEGDLSRLRRSQCIKQTRASRGLWEDSRQQRISILVGLITDLILELLVVLRDGCFGISEDYLWLSDQDNCESFVWVHLLLRFGLNLGCNAVLALSLNNIFVTSILFEFVRL